MTRPGSTSLTRLLRHPCFELLAPPACFVYLHYAFISVYAAPSMTWKAFRPHFAEGIFKYRVLGPDVVVWLHDAMPAGIRNQLATRPDTIALGVPQFDLDLYNTIFLVNFVAFVGTLVIGRSLLRSCLPDNYHSLYWVLIGCMLASTAASTPYDFLAYFFLVTTMAALEWRHAVIAYPALIILTVLGSLTRETQALVIPYAISTLIAASPSRPTVIVPRVLMVAAAFCTTYVALRANLGWAHGIFEGTTFGWQGVLSVFGLVVATAVLILVHLAAVGGAPGPGVRRRLLVLHALALPYWAIVIFGGFYFEVRLFIPIAMVHAAAIVNRSDTEPRISRRSRRPRFQRRNSVAAGQVILKTLESRSAQATHGWKRSIADARGPSNANADSISRRCWTCIRGALPCSRWAPTMTRSWRGRLCVAIVICGGAVAG
jgi:hypothetical protein